MITVVVTEDRHWTRTVQAYTSRLQAEDSVIDLARMEGNTLDLTFGEALDLLAGREWDITVEDVEVQA